MRVSYLLIIFLLMIGMNTTYAQEVVKPIPLNHAKSQKVLQEHLNVVKSTDLPLSLPFWDDFSYKGPYPDINLWEDQNVYINTGFAVHPKTVGVATFDMLDAEGEIYEHIEPGNIQYKADFLTTHPIDLSSFLPEDSLVLSFYYQPQGRGGNPSRDESLVLQFRLPEDNAKDHSNEDNGGDNGDDNGDDDPDEEDLWETVWSASGTSLSEFSQDTFPYFKRVSIPIVDEDFFREDFQFRFLNYVAIPIGQWNNSGTRSIWNIDYVYLDQGRSVFETVYNDIAFAAPGQTILEDYTSIPWSQYIADPASWLRDRFTVRISNLDAVTHNYNYRYFVKDESGTTIATYLGGSALIPPFQESGYQDHGPHATPIVLPNPFSPLIPAAKRNFDVIHALHKTPDGDIAPRNDTIVYHQAFEDYFAFDYGNPESIHLVKGFNPERVLMFTTAHSDLLKAIRVYFMDTVDNQDADRAFEVRIYDSLEPENKIYSSEEVEYTPEDKGVFFTIPLEEMVEVSGTFYIGIRQTGNVTLNNSLVLGFDRSNNVQHRLFIKDGVQSDGNWYQSGFEGALMIRPVMHREATTGVGNLPEADLQLRLYPNPVSGDYIFIDVDAQDWHTGQTSYHIYNTTGRLMRSGMDISTINVSDFKNGIYILRVTNGHLIETTRFIISR